MIRVSLNKYGYLIESQSGGDITRVSQEEYYQKIPEGNYQTYLQECTLIEQARLNTLLENAIRRGDKEKEITLKWVTEAEFELIPKAIPEEA